MVQMKIERRINIIAASNYHYYHFNLNRLISYILPIWVDSKIRSTNMFVVLAQLEPNIVRKNSISSVTSVAERSFQFFRNFPFI